MLEGLDKIDWSKFRHASGVMDDVPMLIRALADATNDTQRNEAYVNLYDKVFPMAALLEVTPHIIPFLIELLENDPEFHGELLMMLMQMLSQTTTARSGHYFIPTYAQLQLDTYWAIFAGFDLYMQLLNRTDIDFTNAIIELISYFYHDVDRFKHILRDVILSERAIDVKKYAFHMLRLSIEQFPFPPPLEEEKLFRQLFATAHDLPITLEAALSLAHIHGIETIRMSMDVEHFLVETFIQSRKIIIRNPILQALSHLARGRQITGLIQIFKAEPEWNELHKIGRELMEAGFKRRELPNKKWNYIDIEEKRESGYFYEYCVSALSMKDYHNAHAALNSWQKKVLQVVVEHDAFWQLPTNLFSFFYGLPDSRDDLRALIEKS
jgi:hypothetical protein